MKKRIKWRYLIPAAGTVLLILAGSAYTCWNAAPADKTCSSCHEINSSVNMFASSAHRTLACKECHGSALSNGLHSLAEKGGMLVNHFNGKSDKSIRLNEDQQLEVMESCIRCHRAEYARWNAGGHSARYSDIFLDTTHNSTEQLNPDCLRCHGMFYEKGIQDLVEPLETGGPWALKDKSRSDLPVIPCMTCHYIHTKGLPLEQARYSDPGQLFYERDLRMPKVSFFNRQDKMRILAEDLPNPGMWEGERPVLMSDDPYGRICIQCHAPNAWHQTGTGDDMTPVGVHEGLSCLACHDNHSNDARGSCVKCHPAISNCRQDVTRMNTTYSNPDSENDIHTVKCIHCHPFGILIKTSPE